MALHTQKVSQACGYLQVLEWVHEMPVSYIIEHESKAIGLSIGL
jgi:hypothetical protein